MCPHLEILHPASPAKNYFAIRLNHVKLLIVDNFRPASYGPATGTNYPYHHCGTDSTKAARERKPGVPK